MDPIDRLAKAHDDVFSVADAAAVGVGSDILDAAVRTRRLVRLARGWYAPLESLRGIGDEGRHRLRIRAAVGRIGRGTVATHHSALLAYGLPLFEADLGVVHVGSTATKRTRHISGRMQHRLPQGTPVSRVGLIPTVTPAVAIVQTGLHNGVRAGLVAADAARRALDPELNSTVVASAGASSTAIDDALRLYRRAPGVVALARTLERTDPHAESVGESLLRYDLWTLGVAVESQFKISIGRATHRADFRVIGTRMLIEFDGLVKLEDPTEQRRADERERAMRRDRWIIVRFTWPELGNLTLISQRLAAEAASHGLAWPVRRAT
ncbi:very-short-patch-repair endonuclease [Kineosphaera limosa]|uniref:DUF559 domain-containing protein n=1 Tax=Kineosphaera limosa NBRC 100340 TaxID=1184609 RepID=K6XG78_9MICO|nr:type IV toxin-antitoxin system AbiEi family antitoxin domain-containing protein [Kineosphaera limosa]NYD98969.1 very-short-patch-repair endonuclease [Kineosphaera limosa]GAB97809.1 hypothetical protein KILIM_083_00050 [Kineosphaera limosa NBRC 100340]